MFTLLWKNHELRKKILLIIGALLIIRIGSIIPIPGINAEYMAELVSGSAFSFINMITGNSLSRMSLFALSISPYITASIIVQLMTVVVPYLEELGKEGKTGRDKIQKITNFCGMGLAFLQALFMAIGFGSRGLLNPYTWWMVLIATIIWTAGACILIWMGEQITKLDLGNGVSFILLFNILSTFSNDVSRLLEQFVLSKTIPVAAVMVVVIVVIFAVLLAACIFLDLTEKRVPMRFSGKMAGRSERQDLPVPLNVCSVMPVIFTGSIFSLPAFIGLFVQNSVLDEITKYLSQSYWFNPSAIRYSAGCILYILMTYYFASFYLSIGFNTIEMAQNFKNQGATIPGIRPGQPTVEYLDNIAQKMARAGTTVMLIIIIGMLLICNLSGIGTLTIGGTSILICTSVIIETYKKLKTTVQSAKSQYYYTSGRKEKGFLLLQTR